MAVQRADGKWERREFFFKGKTYRFSSPLETSRQGWVKSTATALILERRGTTPETLNYTLNGNQLTIGEWTFTRGRVALPK